MPGLVDLRTIFGFYSEWYWKPLQELDQRPDII